MTTPTLDAYRRPSFEPGDALYRRCLAAASFAGALLLVAMLLAPIRHTEITRVDQLSPRFARLILEPSVPRPPSVAISPVTPLERSLASNRPGAAAGAPSGVAAPSGEPAAMAGGGLRSRGQGTLPGGAGSAGRARAQAEVARALGDARAPVASALDGLSDALGRAGGNVVASAGRAERVRTIRAARPDEAVTGSAAGIGGVTAADLGHSVVVGGPVAVGGRSSGFGGRGGPIAGGGGTGSGASGGSGTGGSGGVSIEASASLGGTSAAGGPRSNAALLGVIQKYSAGIQYCYGLQLKHDPTLRGKLIVALTVAASGEVTQAVVVQNTIGSTDLADCALSQIREWRFPPVSEGVSNFRAPFVFTPPN